jgi:hypothetical protein
MSLSQFANPIDGYFVQQEVGMRGTVDDTAPDGDEVDHIAALLRKGLTRGRGLVEWELRTALGVKLTQDQLNDAAYWVEEGVSSGSDPDWRIVIRRQVAAMVMPAAA